MKNQKWVRYTVIVAAICAPTWQGVQWSLRWMERNHKWVIDFFHKKTAIEKTLQLKLKISKALYSIERETRSTHVMVVMGHNGGRPSAVRPFHSTVIEEARDPRLPGVSEMWQEQVVDSSYIAMLEKVYREGNIWNYTEKLPPGILKDLYIKNGIEQSLMIALHETSQAFYYLSITFKEKVALTPQERDTIRREVNNLRHLYRGISP